MQSSNDILDAVAKKLGGVTDYRVAKETGIRQGTISNVRTGKCQLSPEACAACADILGVEAGALIAIVAAERTDNPDIRKSLLRVARRGMAAAALVAAVGVCTAPAPPALASTAPQHDDLFIMSTGGGKRRRPIRRDTVRQTPSPDCLQTSGTYRKKLQSVTKRPTLRLRTSPTLSPA